MGAWHLKHKKPGFLLMANCIHRDDRVWKFHFTALIKGRTQTGAYWERIVGAAEDCSSIVIGVPVGGRVMQRISRVQESRRRESVCAGWRMTMPR